MVRTLRRKFILSAMTAVTLLLVIFLIAVNALNYWSARQDINRTMQLILADESDRTPDDGGRVPEAVGEGDSAPEPDALPPADAGRGGDGQEGDGGAGSRAESARITPEEAADVPEAVPGTEPDSGEGEEGAPDSRLLSGVQFFYVRMASDGRIIYTDTSHIASVDEKAAAGIAEEAASGGLDGGTVSGYIFSREEDEPGGGAVYAFLDEQQEMRSLFRTFLISVLVGAACWALMLLLVVFLSNRAIRPIAENIERQKRFVTDAGHEIRTPLAIISANADVLELHSGASKWIDNIRSQTARLSSLTDNMLTLARMDEGAPRQLPMTEFDAGEAFREAMEPFREMAFLRQITLNTDSVENVRVRYQKEAYTRLVTILLDNAVKYTNEGGEIRASLVRGGRTAVLTVENTAESLPEEDPERLFDRFYRADKARSRKTGGSGIGLATARAIAENTGGKISAEYRKGSRIAFILRIGDTKKDRKNEKKS